MRKKRTPKRWKKRRLKQAYAPVEGVTMPTVTTASPTNVLVEAYPISVYWDEPDQCFVGELAAFNVEVHGASWSEAITAARVAQQLLIETYRSLGYVLPNL